MRPVVQRSATTSDESEDELRQVTSTVSMWTESALLIKVGKAHWAHGGGMRKCHVPWPAEPIRVVGVADKIFYLCAQPKVGFVGRQGTLQRGECRFSDQLGKNLCIRIYSNPDLVRMRSTQSNEREAFFCLVRTSRPSNLHAPLAKQNALYMHTPMDHAACTHSARQGSQMQKVGPFMGD
jgi:hypothetical protein